MTWSTAIKGEINTSADKLIAAVEHGRVKLLSEVESFKVKRVKQLKVMTQGVEQHVAALESLQQYSETLLSSAIACDVTRSVNSLHSRVMELIMFDIISDVASSLLSVNVNYVISICSDSTNQALVA